MNCDFIAPYYAWMESAVFGNALQNRRVKFLSELSQARRILLLGDGDGRFLRELLRSNPRASVDYIDLSAAMQRRARRAAGPERVRYIQGNALAYPFDPCAYDAVVSHFFLDCFDSADLALLVRNIARAATPGARWIISEFAIPGNPWLAAAARVLLAFMYAFFGFTTRLRTRSLADYRRALSSGGFTLMRSEGRLRGLLVSESWGSSSMIP